MADEHPNVAEVARQLGAAEATFDLIHMAVTDAITTGLISPTDAFDASVDAIRIGAMLGRTAMTLSELERRLIELEED